MKSSFPFHLMIFIFASSLLPAQDPPSVSITLDGSPQIVASSAQTISGTIAPIDATLSVNGQSLAVAADGSFSHVVTLHSGINTFLFRGAVSGHTDGVAKRDLIWDTTGPEIRFSQPNDGLKTNQTTVTLSGSVSDTFDTSPSLTYLGNPVALDSGKFTLVDLPLTEGANLFSLTATDGAGNQSNHSLTVHHRTAPPVLQLNHPAIIATGASYAISLSAEPAGDIISLSLTVAQQEVHRTDDATPYSDTLELANTELEIPIRATARDVYGNRVEMSATITVAHPHYIFGQVLDNATSLPLANQSLRVETPFETLNITADQNGQYNTYIQGLPVTIHSEDTAYTALSRKSSQQQDAWRIPDLRLTTRASSQPVNAQIALPEAQLSFSGFSGNAQVTGINGQGLPRLLPIGYSPVLGFEVTGLSGSGQFQLTTQTLPRLPVGGDLIFLRMNADGWFVESLGIHGGSALQWNQANVLDGAYLIALRDTDPAISLPEMGDTLTRQEDQTTSDQALRQAVTVPAVVAITQTPQTDFFLGVDAATTPSGTRARVLCEEQHERIHETLTLPEYGFDIYSYAYGSAPDGSDHGMVGQLPVHCREMVDAETTRHAQIAFKARTEPVSELELLDETPWQSGPLTISFPGVASSPLAADIQTFFAQDLPLGPASTQVTAFEINTGGLLSESALISLTDNSYQNVVLLQRLREGEWAYVGALFLQDALWQNDPAQTSLTQAGAYALVGLDYAITQITGTIYDQSTAIGNVVVQSNQHPWLAVSSDGHVFSLGSYRFFVPQTSETSELHAFDPTTRRGTDHSLPATEATAALANQDLHLQAADFRLTGHEPENDAQFLSRLPQLRLEFSMPLTVDSTNLNTNITLSDGGNDIPLQILVETDRLSLSILPRLTLATDTVYTLSVATGLTNYFGDSLVESASIQFRTRLETATDALDLTRFSLRWENDQLSVTAPQSAFPHRTQLQILNPATAYAWQGQLLHGSDFTQTIDGRPGDTVELEATTPDGLVHRHHLDLIAFSDGSLRLGSQPFTVELAADVIFRADGIKEGLGRQIRLELTPAAELGQVVDAVPAFVGGPQLTPLPGLTITALDGGSLPQIEGRLIIETPTDPQPLKLYLLGINPNVPLPTSPQDLTQTQATHIAVVQDGVHLENSQVVSKRRKTSLGQLSMNFSSTSAYASSTWQLAPVTLPLTEKALITAKIRAYRDPSSAFANLTTTNQWPDLGAVIPAPGTPLFASNSFNGVASIVPVGVTDAEGNAFVSWWVPAGGSPLIFGTDPLTLQEKTGQARRTEEIRDGIGRVIQYSVPQDLHFDKLTTPGQSDVPVQFKVTFEVGRDQNGSFAKDQALTAALTSLWRMAPDPDLRLRTIVTTKPLVDQIVLKSDAFPQALQGERLPDGEWSFLLPSDVLAQERVLSQALLIPNETNPEQRFDARSILIANPNSLVTSQPGPPKVHQWFPEKDALGVASNTRLFLKFTEPVRNLISGTQLKDMAGNIVFLSFTDATDLKISDADYLTEVYLTPTHALDFGKTYTLTLNQVFDHDGDRLNMGDPNGTPVDFNTRFTVKELPVPEPLVTGESEKSYAHYRNLTLVLQSDIGQRGFHLSLFDLRQPDQDPVLVFDTKAEPKLGNHARVGYRMALFTPEDLAWSQDQLLAPPATETALEDLPPGTILTTATTRFIGGAAELSFYEYRGGRFERLGDIALTEAGSPRAVTTLGPYLFLGMYQFLNNNHGRTIVYDIRTITKRIEKLAQDLKANRISQSGFDMRLATVEKLTAYPMPADVWDLNLFYHLTDEAFVPTLLMGGRDYPGITTFNENQLPSAFTAFPGGNVLYDERTHLPTRYPEGGLMPQASPAAGTHHRDGKFNRYTGAIPRLAFWDPLRNQAHIADFALFSEYDRTTGNGFLHIYELPQQPDSQAPAADPRLSLIFPKGLRNIAVDSKQDLVAIQDYSHRVSIFSLQALLEQTPAGTQVRELDLDDDLFLLDKPLTASFGSRLNFHDGVLFGVDYREGQQQVRHIPVTPVIYRTEGWQYLDLASWMEPGPGKDLTTKYAPHMVLYAHDLVASGNRQFHMEQATFSLQVEKPSEIVFTLEAVSPGEAPVEIDSYSTFVARVPTQVNYSSHALAAYFADDLAVVAELRQRGLLQFRLRYQVKSLDRVLREGTSDLWVAYQSPTTRYIDGNRNLGYVDALTSVPDLYEMDHGLSNADSRLDLSPSRYYNADFAFQRGAYGVGMLSGQMLHMALPVWWDPSAVGAGVPNANAAKPRLIFEQPGQFQVNFALTGPNQATATDDLITTFKKDGKWVLVQGDAMTYQLSSSKDLPDVAQWFESINAQAIADGDAENIRYPLFRYRASTTALAQLFAEVSLDKQQGLVWENRMEFENLQRGDRASQLPTEIIETVADLGGIRLSQLQYRATKAGPVVRSNHLPDNMGLQYSHDADGYLTEITWQNARKRTYEWTTVGPKLGNFELKRLKKISQGKTNGQDDWFVEFVYDAENLLKVTAVKTPFGTQSFDVTWEVSGIAKEAILAGVPGPDGDPGSPHVKLFFSDVDGMRLSHKQSVYFGGQNPETFNFPVTWTQWGQGTKRAWVITESFFHDETFTYDAQGRLEKHERRGGSQSWTYDDKPGFRLYPETFTDPAGQTFTMKTEAKKIIVKNGSAEVQQTLSGSGVPYQSTDLMGHSTGAKSTKYYAAQGDGFKSTNGRPTHIPFPGQKDKNAVKLDYNLFGDVTKASEAEVLTQYSFFDDLGRPARITSHGNLVIKSYGYTDGLAWIKSNFPAGNLEYTEYFNEAGWLAKWTETQDETTIGQLYSYDALGRLKTITSLDGSEQIYFARYDDNSSVPALETRPGLIRNYVLESDFNIRITGIHDLIEEKPKSHKFETDVLGRVIRLEETGLGEVEFTYDAFDRLVKKAPVEMDQFVEFKYEGNTVEIIDGIRDITQKLTVKDPAGLERIVKTWGEGIDSDEIERTLKSSISTDEQGQGYRFSEEVIGGAVKQIRAYNSLGYLVSQTYGETNTTATGTYSSFGQPKGFSGSQTASFDFDELGNLKSATDGNNQTSTFQWDAWNRLAGGTDSRGKSFSSDYFGTTGDVKDIRVNGINRSGTNEVTLLSRSDRLNSQSEGYLGATRQQSIPQLDGTLEITRPASGAAKTSSTATIKSDPSTGLLESIQNYSGETSQFQWENGARKLTITSPSGQPRVIRFDGLGQLRTIEEDGVSKLTIKRDDEQRVVSVRTDTHFLEYTYTGQNLTKITGADQTLVLEDHDERGLPANLAIGDLANIQINYHPNGTPQSTTVTRNGGLPTEVQTDAKGDITSIQRGFESPVQYTYNPWGDPASIQVGNGEVTQLFSGDLGTLNLPAGVTALIDEEGRLSELQVPGLAPKQFTYDADDRLVTTEIAGQAQESFVHTDGQLTQIQSGSGVTYADTTDLSYSPEGRLAQVSSSLDGNTQYDYTREETGTKKYDRVQSITDANGVTTKYTYDPRGTLIRLDIVDGPTFRYSYDQAGNLLDVAVDHLRASFADYQHGLPDRMTWHAGGSSLPEFTLTRTPQGRLQELTNGDYRLALTWNEVTLPEGVNPASVDPPVITEVVRKGPGLQETWTPVYDADQRLQSITIERISGSAVDDPNCGDCQTQTIEEQYGTLANQLMGGLVRTLDSTVVLDLTSTLDNGADDRRITSQTADSATGNLTYDQVGNLLEILDPWNDRQTFAYDGQRRVREVSTHEGASIRTESYVYDPQKRRIRTKFNDGSPDLVYVWLGSQVLAIGQQQGDGPVAWTHAFGRGPMGPAFVKDLTGTGADYFLFCDQLGTPFAYRDVASGQTYFAPYNPWGELLAGHPPNGPPYGQHGEVATSGFTLPVDPIFPLPPLGLAGHLYDHTTGLVYMHNRFYHPRLGHFLTPDFRAPDIYDPSTFTEPYAYATGNPIMFWDPDGLEEEMALAAEPVKNWVNPYFLAKFLFNRVHDSFDQSKEVNAAIAFVDGGVSSGVKTYTDTRDSIIGAGKYFYNASFAGAAFLYDIKGDYYSQQSEIFHKKTERKILDLINYKNSIEYFLKNPKETASNILSSGADFINGVQYLNPKSYHQLGSFTTQTIIFALSLKLSPSVSGKTALRALDDIIDIKQAKLVSTDKLLNQKLGRTNKSQRANISSNNLPVLYDEQLALRNSDPVIIKFNVSPRAVRKMSSEDRLAFINHLQEQEDALNWLSLYRTEDLELNLLNYHNLEDLGLISLTRRNGAKRFKLKGTGLDAAHTLDTIAGGYMHDIIGGRSKVQRIIGSLWRTRRSLIEPGRKHLLVPELIP